MGYLKGLTILIGLMLVVVLVTVIAVFGEHAFFLWLIAILLVIWAISSAVVWLRSKEVD
jgi:uncharacterized membrane protein